METYTLREGEVIDNDLIVFGKRVVIEGTVVGDLIVGAGSVEVLGEVQGDVLGFAERIEVNGRVGGNVRTCARTLVVNGEVGRNITAGGEVIRLGPGATLGGSFTAGSKEVSLRAPVTRDLVMAAETSEIHARIGGSALVFGERLTVGPDRGHRRRGEIFRLPRARKSRLMPSSLRHSSSKGSTTTTSR